MVNDIKLPGSGKRSAGDESDSAEEPNFAPPEVLAQEEEVIDMVNSDEKIDKQKAGKATGKKPSKPKVLASRIQAWWKALSKKQKALVALALVLLLAALGWGAYALLHKPAPATPAPVVKEEVKEPPKPTTEPSKLTGVTVPIESNLLPVTGIMIENSPDARPQAGLKDAGVVFEAIAEGGITRFLTLFQEAQPDYVGPIRSARPYYLQWLQGFDAAIAHVGGSPEALAKIRSDGIKDLDQSFNAGSYQRVSNRYAPHNVYTSLAKLIELAKSKGFTSSTFTSLLRKAEAPAATPTAKSINLAISGPLYKVHYDYEAASNSYLRSQAGTPHKDERSGQQIKPKVVVALVMPQGIAADRIHTSYNTLGSGVVFIFQDGAVTQGTWSKANDKEQFRFTDAAGAPLGLNPGQTWFTAVGLATYVTYTP